MEKMTDTELKGNPNDNNTPGSKKLKQARLPFQIISSAVKSSETKSRKRKASLNSSDVKVDETDVKENHKVIPDKKQKTDSTESNSKQKVGCKEKLDHFKYDVKSSDVEESIKSVIVKDTKLEITSDIICTSDDRDNLEDHCIDKTNDSRNNKPNKRKINKIDKREESGNPIIENETLNDEKLQGKSKISKIHSSNEINTINLDHKSDTSKIQTPKKDISEKCTDIDKDDKVTTPDKVSEYSNDRRNSDESISTIDFDSSAVNSDVDATEDKINPAAANQGLSVESIKTPIGKKKRSLGSRNSNTPSLTPKQIEFQQKREEKERLKEAKDRKRAEQKEEKLRIKNEKEDAKRREKEEKERKKQAEIDAKIEEKRLKEEAKEDERKKKEEEKKRKEEERKQKEEEKRLKEEAKNEVRRKSAAAFASFFVPKQVDLKTQPSEVKAEEIPQVDKFMPFQVKVDMRLAPIIRKELQDPDKHYLDSFLKDPSKTVDSSYIQSLKNGNHKPGNCGKTWPIVMEEDDDVIFVVAENSENDSEVKEENKTKKSSDRHRVKLLQFHDNRRPPYWGTWRKRSLTIHPKRPFQMDKTMLEYEVDSDDEWEDIEDGESLRGSDDEESQDENYEEDDDMFVPHGYLSDEEGQDELDDASPEAMKARLKLLQLEFEAERNEKQERLKPRVIGCVWFKNTDDDPSKVGSHIAELFLPCRAVWEGELPISLTANATVYNEESPLGDSSSGLKKIQFPETAISKIITLVHGNRHSKFFLVKELRQCFIKNNITPQPSQKSILQKIKELATWVKCPEEEGGPQLTNKMCWYISKEIRKAYGFHDLQARESLTWEYSLTPPKKSIDKPSEGNDSPLQTTPTLSTTPITKFTKFMSLEERQNQLLNDTESKPQSQKSANSSTPLWKKRVSLTSVPTGTELPKKCKTGLLEKFIQTNCASEIGSTVTKSPSQQSNSKKQLQKTPKRIKPIPFPREDNKISESDCIVLSD